SQNCDHVKVDVVLLQEHDTLHHPRVRTFPRPGFAVCIVEEGRTVNANSYVDMVLLDEVAPLLSQQDPVCLDVMRDLAPNCIQGVNFPERGVVEKRSHQRFARVPHNTQAETKQVTCKQLEEQLFDRDKRYPSLGLAIWQITVVAVDVAKWSRL